MGKSKAKKGRPSAIEELMHSPHEPQCTCHHDHPPRAADGHDVDGWTDEDIRIYNELLTERAKLEKEKNELEQKSARHQAERALLNEDAAAFDNLFKAQLGGEYKFTGKVACCLDVSNDSSVAGQLTASNTLCHHEICTRAKNQGVSWMEMDTIKYYQARITSEKSQRMKNALRKQRDVELTRVKKDDEEENAMRLRRSAMQEKSHSGGKDDLPSPGIGAGDELALTDKNSILDPKENAILEAAKENEMVVKRIRSRLDRIRHDVSAGRVSPGDARAKLDQANKEMAEAERKNNTFKEMVFTAGTSQELTLASNSTNLSRALSKSLASSSTDAFTQALSVMKGFFSASDPRDVQAAITDLRSVLEVNGPMSPVLQKSFHALEEMLAKPNAKGFSVDLTNRDGTKRTCTNVVEVLLMLRNSEDPTTLDATAEELKLDKATLQANRECIEIEEGASNEMREMWKDKDPATMSATDAKELMDRLREIKDEAAMRSPIPPLSDIVLEGDMNNLLYFISSHALITQAAKGASERDVAGKLTSFTITYSQRDPERYMKSLQQMSDAMESFRPEIEGYSTVAQAITNVQDSMGKFVEKHKEKVLAKIADAKEAGQNSAPPSPALPDSLVPGPLQPKKQTKNSRAISQSALSPIPGLDASQLASLDMSGVMKVVQNMQQQLKGLTPDDLVNMLCTPETGQTDTQATNILKSDLQKFLNLPTGLEDPKLLSRIQQQISHLASHDRDYPSEPKQPPRLQDSKPKQSKFQEELPTSPSPPPYTANEGRTRSSVKVKHVPVNTPQISGAPSSLDVSDRDRLIAAAKDFQAKSLEQKAQEMSNDLHKMRKDLLELTNLPGLSGNLAKKVRRQLDSLRRDMEKMEISDPLAETKDETAASNNGTGAEKAVTEQPEPLLQAPSQSPSPPSGEVNALTPKKKSKKRPAKKPTSLSAQPPPTSISPLPSTAPTPSQEPAPPPPPLTPDPTLSDREAAIQRQLYTLACCLDRLIDTPGPVADQYGFKDAFRGIVGKLEQQMIGHVEMARWVSDVNGWTGLEGWLERTF